MMEFSMLGEPGKGTIKAPTFTGSRIVFSFTIAHSVTAIAVFVAAVAIFLTKDMTASISACQGLFVFTALVTFLYVGLYLLAAQRNDDIGRERPPTRRLHAIIFILLRASVFLWGLGIMSSSIVISKPGTYTKSPLVVILQRLDIVLSSFGFLTSTIILYFLETCSYPFETPNWLSLRPNVVCRMSTFGEDILSRSVSLAGSFNADDEQEKCQRDLENRHEILQSQQTLQQQTMNLERTDNTFKMPGAFPRAHLSPSCSNSSSDWTSVSGSSVSLDSGRKITPSSSISNMSRRSPLSTMRYVDYPDIVIKPELRYIPPQYPSIYDVNVPLLRVPAPLSGPTQLDLTAPVLPLPPLPTATPDRTQHHSSLLIPALSKIQRGHSYESIRLSSNGGAKTSVGSDPPPPPELKAVRIVNRKTISVKVPEKWEDPYAEQVEEHSKKIFAEIASEQRQSMEKRGVQSLREKISAAQLRKKRSWDM